MSLILFPLSSLIAYITNWCVEFTFLCVMVSIAMASVPDINKHKKRLAALHLLLEFTFLLNLIVIIGYWGLVHWSTIDTYSGWVYLHMYIVHIFPTLAFFLNAKVTHFQLCADHWILVTPLGLLYGFINY